ncbi:MAG TPA: branched-chain amino acid ABC transporter permease [Stellaceae bacterium]|nr:branched-chain amino acid ABC transporter permease [Stellaceae bacterium]
MVTILLIAVLPLLFQGTYARSILVVCAINVLIAIGLDIVIGYAGQLNLGQSAFFAIGAYVSTLLVTLAGVDFWIAFLAGTIGAALAGAGLALFAVRLRGHYLAIASMGFAIIVYQILMNWISLTQGPLGIYGIPPPPAWRVPSIGRIDFSDIRNFFWLVAAVAIAAYLLLRNLLRSPVGEALIALREDEVSAASLGIDGARWKIFAFAVAAALAGMAGCFYASFVGTLVPDAFFITESFTVLAMVIVGGAGTLLGPAAGAVLLTVLPELLRGIGDARLVIYGLALTLVVLFMPGGMAQAARLITERAQHRQRRR